MELKGGVAIVTGAARGIGKAIVGAFAAEGGAVWCADLHGAEAEAVAFAFTWMLMLFWLMLVFVFVLVLVFVLLL